ncbi:Mn-dependent DtxR family transcriptional regulator [Methanohalophilus levihalophilus]|uniref:transcriptional regulator n=1 Tax=Methanohalophilus levihalophilus TaxID=1431282 RepID=UPI001FD956F5|nr:transcriptional regulator [Methanohalophilus levihalophilus]MBP2030734.1 Mn-dependent DtxR family transcriptional regulator [Methanohalophilus levihalophilus]
MEEELMGFVTGNNNRQKLLTLLGSKGELDVKHISKLMHVIEPSVEKMVSELEEKGLLSGNNGLYSLTEEGTAIERKIQNI